jgi:hypothetical protein
MPRAGQHQGPPGTRFSVITGAARQVHARSDEVHARYICPLTGNDTVQEDAQPGAGNLTRGRPHAGRTPGTASRSRPRRKRGGTAYSARDGP